MKDLNFKYGTEKEYEVAEHEDGDVVFITDKPIMHVIHKDSDNKDQTFYGEKSVVWAGEFNDKSYGKSYKYNDLIKYSDNNTSYICIAKDGVTIGSKRNPPSSPRSGNTWTKIYDYAIGELEIDESWDYSVGEVIYDNRPTDDDECPRYIYKCIKNVPDENENYIYPGDEGWTDYWEQLTYTIGEEISPLSYNDYQGTWSLVNAYTIGSIVRYEGKIYYCTEEVESFDGHPLFGDKWIALCNNDPISVTYDNLMILKNSNALTTGQKYRITDYKLSIEKNYIDKYNVANNHRFDVIVTAISTSELSTKASAAHHVYSDSETAGIDAYYKNDLSKWELEYVTDIDSYNYTWVNTATDIFKGHITYMKDDYGNECYYDFKQLLIDGKFTFNYIKNDKNYDATSYDNRSCLCINNIIKPYYTGVSNSNFKYKMMPNNIIIQCGRSGKTIKSIKSSLVQYLSCSNNVFGEGCHDIIIGKNSNNNTFGKNCYNIEIPEKSTYVNIDDNNYGFKLSSKSTEGVIDDVYIYKNSIHEQEQKELAVDNNQDYKNPSRKTNDIELI